MSSTHETGHAKNVTNFHDLIDFCIGYGSAYNPSRVDLRVANLQLLETDALAALDDVITKRTTFNNVVNVRISLFAGLRSLSTRLINALEATDASKQMIRDAKSINKKIHGKRISRIEAPIDPSTPVPITISTSQLSYDQLVQHFTALIEILNSEPSYAPNETELQIATISAYKNDLIVKNNEVSLKYTEVSNSRIIRNNLLYKEPTGLVFIAQEVKKYIKSLYGATSQEFAQVKGIIFTIKKI